MISLVLGFALHIDEDRGFAVDLDILAAAVVRFAVFLAGRNQPVRQSILAGGLLGIALVGRDSEASSPPPAAAVLAVAPRAVPEARTADDAGNHLAAAVAAAVPAWEQVDAVGSALQETMAFIYPTFQQPH